MQIKKISQIFFFILLFSTRIYCQFVDINKSQIVSHNHISPNLLGGGVGIIDIDNDGWEDIYLTGGAETDKLIHNLGDLQFEDVSTSSFIFQYSRTNHTNSVSIADLNNDGFDDIFLTTIKGQSNVILINRGNGTFENITSKSGISEFKEWGMSAIFIDVNLDGYLDIYVLNYIEEPGAIFDDENQVIGFKHICFENNLFLNNQDLTFTENAKKYNLSDAGCGLAAITSDINQDGYFDILIANDFGEWVEPNKAYVFNPITQLFDDLSSQYHLSDSIYGMGIATADLNADLVPDYYITNIGSNELKLSTKFGDYMSVSDSFGIENTTTDNLQTTGWGCLLLDANNYGINDLYVSNGYIGSADFLNTNMLDSNRFYISTPEGYQEVTIEYGLHLTSQSRGAVEVDLNNDGNVDIITINTEKTQYAERSNVNFYLNKPENSGNWVSIILEGYTDNKNGLGSKVILYENGNARMKELNSGGSHASSNSKRIHFGIDQNSKIDSVQIHWPNQSKSLLKDIPINNFIRIRQDSSIEILGCKNLSWGCKQENTLLKLNHPNSSKTSIHPNPSVGSFTIISSESFNKITIYDLAGHAQLILNKSSKNRSALIEHHLDPGIYLVEFGSNTQKIVVQK